jgi:hypothetical protein
MKTRSLFSVFVLGVFLAVAVCAHAQEGVTVNIPYKFEAGGKQFAAGQYTIDPGDPSQSVLFIRSLNGKDEAELQVLTRISRGDVPTASQARVVLDKYPDKYILSEIFVPGEDGYLLKGSAETAHQHQTVKGKSHKKA